MKMESATKLIWLIDMTMKATKVTKKTDAGEKSKFTINKGV